MPSTSGLPCKSIRLVTLHSLKTLTLLTTFGNSFPWLLWSPLAIDLLWFFLHTITLLFKLLGWCFFYRLVISFIFFFNINPTMINFLVFVFCLFSTSRSSQAEAEFQLLYKCQWHSTLHLHLCCLSKFQIIILII